MRCFANKTRQSNRTTIEIATPRQKDEKVRGEKMMDELLQKIKSIAKMRGFEVETCNGWQRMFSLKENEIALVCDTCGEIIETTIDRPDIFEWISSVKCPSGDKCILEYDERILTRDGTMAWCKDSLGVIETIVNSLKSSIESAGAVSSDNEYLFEIDDFTNAYFAVNPNGNQPNSAYGFIKCAFENSWRYALFHFVGMSTDETQVHIDVGTHNLWSSFETELDQLITRQLENRICNVSTNPVHMTDTFDFYTTLALKFVYVSPINIWMYNVVEDSDYKKYVKMNTCPVCGMIHTSKDSICDNCGFTEILPVFINADEGRYWKKHIIPTYRHDFIAHHFEIEGSSLVRRKSDKEFYSLIIPAGISLIKEKAFADLKRLHNIVLPEGLQEIEDNAFDNCFNLTKVNFPNSIRIIGERAFSYTDLYTVVLPSQIETIKSEAFASCYKLTTIVIPRSVINMGSDVLRGCTSLRHVFCETECQPDGWDQNWLSSPGSFRSCLAEVHWGGTWHYNEESVPVPN